MSDRAAPIRVLHVDDEPGFADVTAEALEREDQRFEVEAVDGAAAGLEAIETGDVDCVVSDYDMPDTDGISFLEAVREEHPELPFVLFTGKGSEEIASEAFSAGATEYLQKTTAGDQYTVLANRIAHVVEEKRAREAKAESEYRLTQLANQTNDVLWMITADWEEILFVNAAYDEVYGRSREALQEDALDFLQAIHPDDRERVEAAMARTAAGEETELEYRVNEDEDYGRWVWAQAQPIRNDDGEVVRVAGFSRDVTDRHENRRQLERVRDFFENAERLGDLGAWEYDASGDATWTEGTRRIHEVGEDFEPTLEAGLEFVHPDDREAVDRAVESAIEAGESYDLEAKIVTAEDDTRWVRLSGEPIDPDANPVRVRGYIQDVTDRVERERELEQYRTIVETIPEGVFVIDEEGTIELGNDRAASMLGYGVGELVGEDFGRLIEEGVYDPEIIETYLDHVRTMLSAESDREQAQFDQPVTVDGEERILEIHLTLRPYEDEFRGTVGVIRDATDERRQQETLRRQNERLEEFATIVSHDLRNPLHLAMGRLELARQACSSAHLDVVDDAHHRMERLIDDLLTIAREGKSPADFEPVHLADFVRSCWESVDTADATLEPDLDATVRADEVRLRELFENLFRNAVEHGNGDVSVTVGQLSDGFYVADDGPGIPAAEREDVFEYGYSTSESGTGFGLSIVARVAEAHDWEVSVTASEAGGTRFEVTGVEFAGD